MGDPKKQSKKYETPRFKWSTEQLEAELRLLGDYGLRNKREIWRHRSTLSKYRTIARGLLAKPRDERARMEKQQLKKLHSMGIISEKAILDDILGLSIEDILERRLQTIVLRRGFAKTPSQARQLVVHGHISIGGKRVTVPSYIVKRSEEPLVTYTVTSILSSTDHPLRKELSVPIAATVSASEEGDIGGPINE